MINKEKWVDSLPQEKLGYGRKPHIQPRVKTNQIDNYRWVNTIVKKKTVSVLGKYSFITVLFIFGLLFVSVVKNETRNLEKEINTLTALNNAIKFNLDQALLDNEVITSPENISKLAKEHLNTNFISYKKSQIKGLSEDSESVAKLTKKNNNLSKKIKKGIGKEIKKKKTEIKKLQELYSNPKSIPKEIKTEVAKKIKEKKIELKNLYSDPKVNIFQSRTYRWAAVQVVKLFLGIPVVPGR